MPESLTVEGIYAQIRAEFDGRITPESRLILKYDADSLVLFDADDEDLSSHSHIVITVHPNASRCAVVTSSRCRLRTILFCQNSSFVFG